MFLAAKHWLASLEDGLVLAQDFSSVKGGSHFRTKGGFVNQLTRVVGLTSKTAYKLKLNQFVVHKISEWCALCSLLIALKIWSISSLMMILFWHFVTTLSTTPFEHQIIHIALSVQKSQPGFPFWNWRRYNILSCLDRNTGKLNSCQGILVP